MFTNPMRDKYDWEKLNPGRKREMRAGYVYTVAFATPTRNGDTAGLKRKLTLVVLAAMSVALVVMLMVAAAAAH